MDELTKEQKEQAQKVMDELINYIWSKVETRMIFYGESYEQAWLKVQEEIANEAKP